MMGDRHGRNAGEGGMICSELRFTELWGINTVEMEKEEL